LIFFNYKANHAQSSAGIYCNNPLNLISKKTSYYTETNLFKFQYIMTGIYWT